MLLHIKDLTATAGDKTILDGLTLAVPRGGVHVIMGPNGSGKSTLCGVIMGHPDFAVTDGTMTFEGADLRKLKTYERARRGIFLGFQYPREIPGVSLAQVTSTALRAKAKEDKAAAPPPNKDLIARMKTELTALGLAEEFLRRPLNENASGGEKKRLEIVQLAMLAPKLAILDEIDSGLDIDGVRSIANAIRTIAAERGTTFLVITHYPRLLRHLSPERIHVMAGGTIVRSGDRTLADALERDGYKVLAP